MQVATEAMVDTLAPEAREAAMVLECACNDPTTAAAEALAYLMPAAVGVREAVCSRVSIRASTRGLMHLGAVRQAAPPADT